MEETRHLNSFVTSHYLKGVEMPYNKHAYTVHGGMTEKRSQGMWRRKRNLEDWQGALKQILVWPDIQKAFCGGYICHHVS